MNVFKTLLAEISYRKLNFAISLLAVVIAVGLFVATPLLVAGYRRQTHGELTSLEARVIESAAELEKSEAQQRQELARLEDETRKLMVEMGFNLNILHADTDAVEFLSTRLPEVDMPEQWIHQLAGDSSLTMVTHLVATLRGKITCEGREVYLVGYLPETPQARKPQTEFAKRWGHQRKPMGYDISPGTVQLGYALGVGKRTGETILLGGKPFQIARVLPEKGSEEDVTVAVHLRDAQALLKKPGKINQIMALECRCNEADLPRIRKQVRAILPETRVVRDKSKADARARQRGLVKEKHQQIVAEHRRALAEREQALADTAARREKIQDLLATFAAVITPLVVLVAAIWVGLLALANVRERRTEIGILRALGKGSGTIAGLFLGKAVLVGLLGAGIGFLLGTGVGYALGTDLPRILGAQPLYDARDHFTFPYMLLGIALVGAPLLSAVASYLPTLSAVLQDPAVVLRDQ